MGQLLPNEQYLLDQCVIIHFSHLQPLWLTLHLHATHVILVMQVDEFSIFTNLYI